MAHQALMRLCPRLRPRLCLCLDLPSCLDLAPCLHDFPRSVGEVLTLLVLLLEELDLQWKLALKSEIVAAIAIAATAAATAAIASQMPKELATLEEAPDPGFESST